MARPVTDVDVLQEYISGVMTRAAHHAGAVEEIALAIAGAIVWRKEGELSVREYAGKMANMLWVTISGYDYALVYNHKTQKIEVRERTSQKRVLREFDNTSTAREVKDFFAGL